MTGNALIKVVSVSGSTPDKYGNASSASSEATWDGAFFAPRYSNENPSAQGAPVVTGLTIYGPPVALTAHDQIKVGDVLYDIVGEPGDWKNPWTGWHPGLEVAVKRAGAE